MKLIKPRLTVLSLWNPSSCLDIKANLESKFTSTQGIGHKTKDQLQKKRAYYREVAPERENWCCVSLLTSIHQIPIGHGNFQFGIELNTNLRVESK
jgi:hypothetical protein